jgi:hypothetical protein
LKIQGRSIQSLYVLSILILLIKVEPLTAETGQYFVFKHTTAATIVHLDGMGKPVSTHKYFVFSAGEYAKAMKVLEDGSLLIPIIGPGEPKFVHVGPTSSTIDLQSISKSSPSSPPASSDKMQYQKPKGTEEIVERLEPGSTGLLGRLMGNKGLKQALVYYDAEAGYRTALRADPDANDNCSSPAGGKSSCVAYPSTGDPLKIIDTTIRSGSEGSSINGEPTAYYLVETTYCPNDKPDRCSQALQTRRGWIAAGKVGPFRREPPAERVDTADGEFIVEIHGRKNDTCSDSLTSKLRELQSLSLKAESSFFEKLEENLGTCLLPSSDSKQLYSKDELKEFKTKYFATNTKAIGAKTGFVPSTASRSIQPTAEQLFEMDMLARTLFGEMRNCSHQSPDFYRIITRVILNRVEIIKNDGYVKPFVSPQSPHAKPNPPEHIILADVLSQPKQISSWNTDDKNDRNIYINLCPDRETKQPRTSERSKRAWKYAVTAAWEAVMNRKQFLADTAAITHTHYTSGMVPWWTERRKGDVLTIDGRRASERCLILWRDQ